MKRDKTSDDDEADTDAKRLFVSNYHLEDEDDMPVSFAVLPILWSETESSQDTKEQVFLHGSADNGLQKIFMQVIAWRFDLTNVKPEISLLSKDRRWIKLHKPRKSFEDTVRTTLVTVHFLHRVKKNPQISTKSLWDNLRKHKELSSYEFRPSQTDLLNHMALIGEAARRDTVLAKSKFLLTILEEKPGNKNLHDEKIKDLSRPGFIVDDIEKGMIDEADEESVGDGDLFCSVCELCDNGGKLLCCDGKCMRSFHATEEDGTESMCDSLGLAQKEVDEIQNFYCKNCEYGQHQCFACGKLGSSDKVSGAEVFKCVSATCGCFYHPHCVAKLLAEVVQLDAEELVTNIADGEHFTCPIHYCSACKETENKMERELQFAVCRRCPKSYHRKCLPREITFEDTDDEDNITRAWEGLLPNSRILIYCLNHEIDEELGTPMRDHIKFPDVKATVRETGTTNKKTKPSTKKRVISNKSNVDLDNSSGKKMAKGSELTRNLSSRNVTKKSEKMISGSNISRNPKANEASSSLTGNERAISKEIDMPDQEEDQPSLGEKLLLDKGSEKINPDNQADNVAIKTQSVKPTRKMSSALPPLDADSERRLLAFFEEASSSITLENVLEKYKFASTHTHSLKNVVEKTITVGKLEGTIDAVRTALRMLEGGCSVQDVEAVCDTDVLNQLFKWKIVDKLHWYVQNGDMIVDFCCGANDFSILMKKKLEETGKKCLYKNYDILPTKNDFSFEMRDWMTVQPKELATGSQLIMGLNPPFGLRAALANKLIDKALEFKPKLLVLIEPPQTEGHDRKRTPYDLIWEDDKLLCGKSFYLPGSVDVNDKHIDQWNVKPPVLYLWSRPDWTAKHKVIAQEQGHIQLPADHTIDGNYGDNFMPSHDLLRSNDDLEYQAPNYKDHKESSPHGNVDQDNQEGQEQRMRKPDKTVGKRKHVEEIDRGGPGVDSPANKRQAVDERLEGVPDHSEEGQKHRMSKSDKRLRKREHIEENDTRGLGLVAPANKRQAVNEMLEGAPDHGQPNPSEGRAPVEVYQPRPDVKAGDDIYQHLEPLSCSGIEFGTPYSGNRKWPSATCPSSDYGVKNIDELRDWEEEKYSRESDIRRRLGLNGVQGPDSTSSNYLSGHDPAYCHMGYGQDQLGSVTESSNRMNAPAMDRYAPDVKESIHVSMGYLRSEPPTVGRSGTSYRSVPQPGSHGRPLGFASGPHPAYSRRHSAGWLDE